nr:2-C-methyl-D-erythritol 2,4-cyclodiphosphate synthase [bacterium]
MALVEAVVVAAGASRRMRGADKLALKINGKSILAHTVEGVLACERVGRIILCVRAEQVEEMSAWLSGLQALGTREWQVIAGGEERHVTVSRALSALSEDCSIVVIQDGARPMCTGAWVDRGIDLALAEGAAVAGHPARDTIKQVEDGGRVVQTPPRSRLWHAETPQVFQVALLRQAHARAMEKGLSLTDDAMAMEIAGYPVRMYEVGANIKVTVPEDLCQVRALKGDERTMRIGYGFDAHRLATGRRLVLCGVTVPCTRGLLGHSDADVAVHALMDALLGACALGDIGQHFPQTAEFDGANSMALLARVMALVDGAGYRLENCDITLTAQSPRLAPYIPAMRQALAGGMNVELGRVSVKATTTEHMGYEGRGEGISAAAVVLLSPKGDDLWR